MSEHLFDRDGDLYLPTAAGGSPWHPDLLHGGTATGLLGHLVARELPAGFRVLRVTFDLLRPVPRAPLAAQARPVRDGGRLKIVEITVSHAGKPVCRAAALLAKGQAVSLPDYAPVPQPPPPGPDGLPSFSIQDMLDAKGLAIPRGLHSRVEVRSQEPWRERGRNTSWLRLPVTLLAGVPLTAFERACLVSDLGNGVAQLNLGAGVGMINADVTLALAREPQGEWLALQSAAQVQADGLGVVHTTLYDRAGSVGTVVQSVLANREFSG